MSKNARIRISKGSSNRWGRGERARLLVRANDGNGGHGRWANTGHHALQVGDAFGLQLRGREAIAGNAGSRGLRSPAMERIHCANGTHAFGFAHGMAKTVTGLHSPRPNEVGGIWGAVQQRNGEDAGAGGPSEAVVQPTPRVDDANELAGELSADCEIKAVTVGEAHIDERANAGEPAKNADRSCVPTAANGQTARTTTDTRQQPRGGVSSGHQSKGDIVELRMRSGAGTETRDTSSERRLSDNARSTEQFRHGHSRAASLLRRRTPHVRADWPIGRSSPSNRLVIAGHGIVGARARMLRIVVELVDGAVDSLTSEGEIAGEGNEKRCMPARWPVGERMIFDGSSGDLEPR